jgi:hypothetical protein
MIDVKNKGNVKLIKLYYTIIRDLKYFILLYPTFSLILKNKNI